MSSAAHRKKRILDVFGSWGPMEERGLVDHIGTALPSPIVPVASLLEYSFELRDNDKVPYDVLDRLRRTHSIDVSALSWSLTAEGNRYRSHCLLVGY